MDDFKGPRGPLKHRCQLCSVTGKPLSLCTGCRIVRYCCRDHQVQHRPDHKSLCNKIKKSRAKLEAEDLEVRNATADFATPANAFETHAGHFWGILGTRDYMRARFALADSVRRIGTVDGVTEGLDHLMDMMRLCRSDNLGVRSIVPALMLQLDKDQECYDFIKWYQTEGRRDEYDWGDLSLPFLDFKGADVLESLDYMRRRYGDTNHISALLLLNIKMLLDVINIRLTRKVLAAKELPPELWSEVEAGAVRSPLCVPMCKLSFIELVAMEGKLLRHIKTLGSLLRDANDNVITGLLEAQKWLASIPHSYSQGSPEEMQLILQHSYAAWWETEGALELLQNAKRNAANDSEREIADMMNAETFKSRPGSSRTAAELLEDVSLNRIWAYIDWAAEDAGSLAAERPSDVHIKELEAMVAEEEGLDSSDSDADDVDSVSG